MLLAIGVDENEQTTAIGVLGRFGPSLQAANGAIAKHVGNLADSRFNTKFLTNKVLVIGEIG